jgi:glyoxylase-like metal-dependent hydrolase (beta-lactamase superfamily II)
MALTVYPVVASRMVIDLGRMTYLRNYGRARWLPCPFFIIKGEGKVWMVDTGAPAAVMAKLRTEPVEDIMSFEEALATVDLKPGDISCVVLTHLMYDHCANGAKLPNAEFYIQSEELPYARDPHPLFAGAYHPELFDGLRFKIIQGDFDLVPGIKLIHTPGHSPGCQSVAVATSSGTVVITGFCCTMENFSATGGSAWPSPYQPDVIPPGIHMDFQKAYESAKRVKAIADIIVPMHDPSLTATKHLP